MSNLQKLMESPLYKAVLEDMDAAGANTAKISFDVEGTPMLGLVITVGDPVTKAVQDAVARIEEGLSPEPSRIIMPGHRRN